MIESVTFEKKPTKGEFAHIRDIFALNGRTFAFTPGLNIIVGPNGSGKSTMTKAIATHLAAVQGGVSVVTRDWLHTAVSHMAPIGGGEVKNAINCSVRHDGKPVVYTDPRRAVGRLSGGGLDDDFYAQGVFDVVNHVSSGQKTMERMGYAMACIAKHQPFPQEISYKVHREEINESWKETFDAAHNELLASTIEPGPPTAILDEPEACFSLPLQAQFWDFMDRAAKARHCQVIVASHSPFCFGISNAHYIELEKGYVVACQDALRQCSARVAAASKIKVTSVPKKRPAKERATGGSRG